MEDLIDYPVSNLFEEAISDIYLSDIDYPASSAYINYSLKKNILKTMINLKKVDYVDVEESSNR